MVKTSKNKTPPKKKIKKTKKNKKKKKKKKKMRGDFTHLISKSFEILDHFFQLLQKDV